MPRLRRPRYADVTATLALVLALGTGGAYAATSLVSTGQIANGAVTTAKIHNGAVTAAKVQAHSIGSGQLTSTVNAALARTGATTLPSGKSESGVYAVGGTDAASSGWLGLPITYTQPLASHIADANIIYVSGSPVTHCSGPGHADRGYLCIYSFENSHADWWGAYSTDITQTPSIGVIAWFTTSGSGAYAGGTWTVTAP